MCLWAALLKFGRENSTSFYRQGRQLLLTFLAMVTRWSRFTSKSYALIGQNWSSEFMWNIYAATENLFTDSRGWQSFVSSCDVFNCLLPLAVKNEIQLLSRFFCHSCLVCLLGFWLRNVRLSNFEWHRFCFSPCSICPLFYEGDTNYYEKHSP